MIGNRSIPARTAIAIGLTLMVRGTSSVILLPTAAGTIPVFSAQCAVRYAIQVSSMQKLMGQPRAQPLSVAHWDIVPLRMLRIISILSLLRTAT